MNELNYSEPVFIRNTGSVTVLDDLLESLVVVLISILQ